MKNKRDPIHLVTGFLFLGLGAGLIFGEIIYGLIGGVVLGFGLKYLVGKGK